MQGQRGAGLVGVAVCLRWIRLAPDRAWACGGVLCRAVQPKPRTLCTQCPVAAQVQDPTGITIQIQGLAALTSVDAGHKLIVGRLEPRVNL